MFNNSQYSYEPQKIQFNYFCSIFREEYQRRILIILIFNSALYIKTLFNAFRDSCITRNNNRAWETALIMIENIILLPIKDNIYIIHKRSIVLNWIISFITTRIVFLVSLIMSRDFFNYYVLRKAINLQIFL